nr:Arfaptin domain containing protein [Haemonchus contortus]
MFKKDYQFYLPYLAQMMSETNIFQPSVRCDPSTTASSGTEANADGTDVMSRFPNLPKMAEAVGNVDVVAKVESLKKWTIGTFKNSRQQLLEHMGKVTNDHQYIFDRFFSKQVFRFDKTTDEQFEKECEELKELHRRYGCVVNAAREFTNLLTQLTQAEKNLAESLQQLSVKELAIKPQCTTTSDSMRRVAEQATALDGCLRYFLSSMETLHAKTIVDTLETIYATEGARIEFDVSRHELESLHSHATASPTAIQVASDKANQHRDKYEGLKADVRVKLRLLEENRVKVMSKQLEQLQMVPPSLMFTEYCIFGREQS